MRIVGGAVHIAAEEQNTPSIGVFVTAFSLEAAGLSPLMLCTTSFLGVVCVYLLRSHCKPYADPFYSSQHASRPLPLSNTRLFRILRLVILVALILAIVGGSEAASSKEDDRSTGTTLRKVSAILSIISFVTIVAIHAVYWANKDLILRHRRTVNQTTRVIASFADPKSHVAFGGYLGSSAVSCNTRTLCGPVCVLPCSNVWTGWTGRNELIALEIQLYHWRMADFPGDVADNGVHCCHDIHRGRNNHTPSKRRRLRRCGEEGRRDRVGSPRARI